MKPMAGLFSETEKGLTVCVEGQSYSNDTSL